MLDAMDEAAERLRWVIRGDQLDEGAGHGLAAHVAAWSERLPGYRLWLAPARRSDRVILYGELPLPGRPGHRLVSDATPGSADAVIVIAVSALGELSALVAAALPSESGELAELTRALASVPVTALPSPAAPGSRAEAAPAAAAPPDPPEDPRLDALQRAIAELGMAMGHVAVSAWRDIPDQARDAELRASYLHALDAVARSGKGALGPAVALALADGLPPDPDPAWIEGVCRCLRAHPVTRPLLLAVADLPGFARAAERADRPGFVLDEYLAGDQADRTRNADDRTLREGDRWLEHPYWELRLATVPRYQPPDAVARAACSVWHTIDAAGYQVGVAPRLYAQPLPGVPPYDWAAIAAPLGGLVPLPPLPSLEDGAASTCADLRAWCRERLGLPPEPVAAALPLDELTRQRLLAADERLWRHAAAEAARLRDVIAGLSG